MLSAKNIIAFIVLVLITVAEIIFLRRYFKAFYPRRTKTSLKLKMCAATCYVAQALLGVLYCGRFNRYAISVLIALALSWVGDLFLHLPNGNEKVNYGIGSISFFVGHFFFISAYLSAQKEIRHLYSNNSYDWQWYVPVLIAVSLMILYRILGVRIKKALIVPCFLYSLLVSAMAVSAFALACTALEYRPGTGLLPVTMLSLGGLCFLQSDMSLGMSFFSPRYKTLRVRIFTTMTYFTAQALLACTVFFFG